MFDIFYKKQKGFWQMQPSEKEDLTTAIQDGIYQAKKKEERDKAKGCCGCLVVIVVLVILWLICLFLFGLN